MYNRQQRRKIEKNLGLTKEYSKKSEKEKSEIRHERIEKGKQIHAKNTQEIRDRQAEADALRFQQRINSLRVKLPKNHVFIEKGKFYFKCIYKG
jgi:hypothetical protein